VGSSCSARNDHSVFANPVETVGTMILETPDAQHNYQPYFTDFSSSNFFNETKTSINDCNTASCAQSVFVVARP
jgi:hypothetical protein